jgi:hypothetical protein
MAAQIQDEKHDSAVPAEEVTRILDRIFTSKYFSHAPKKQKFLKLVCQYYVNGRAAELNEYLIGREVFDRDDSYNPSADPIVRVGAHDVRKKLDLFYENEGAGDNLRLVMPIGSYEPFFIRQEADPSPIEDPPILPPEIVVAEALTTQAPRRDLLVAGAAILVLLVIVAALWMSNRSLSDRVADIDLAREGTAFGPVWKPFFRGDDVTLVVISNPPIYRFSNAIDPEIVAKNAIGLNGEQEKQLADTLKDKFVMKQTRRPKLILSPEDYTGMGEAIGLHRITDLFRSTGRTLLLRQSRTATAEDLKNHNVVLLGSVWANEWSGRLPVREDFVYSGNATIENRDPQSGEGNEYLPEFDPRTGELLVDYALVTVKPNISLENTVMVLAGIHSEGTEAAAEFVTTRNYLQELNQRLGQLNENGTPVQYYQALLKVGVENGIPTTISIVSIHGLRMP